MLKGWCSKCEWITSHLIEETRIVNLIRKVTIVKSEVCSICGAVILREERNE